MPDMCYFVNILDLIWIWIFPQSHLLFICCYLLTMGEMNRVGMKSHARPTRKRDYHVAQLARLPLD